jgi:hypothetical protein
MDRRQKSSFWQRAAKASMSTGDELAVKSKLPIRLMLRQATGEMPLRMLLASRLPAASFCSYTRDSCQALYGAPKLM